MLQRKQMHRRKVGHSESSEQGTRIHQLLPGSRRFDEPLCDVKTQQGWNCATINAESTRDSCTLCQIKNTMYSLKRGTLMCCNQIFDDNRGKGTSKWSSFSIHLYHHVISPQNACLFLSEQLDYRTDWSIHCFFNKAVIRTWAEEKGASFGTSNRQWY